MKTRLCILFGLLLLTGNISPLSAQYKLEYSNSHPRSGDRLIKREVSFKDPGRSGKDVLWDFSQLTPIEKYTTIFTQPIETIDPSEDISKYAKHVLSNETGVVYFTDTIGVASSDNGTGSIYRHNNTPDSLLVWGYEQPGIRIENDLPEVWLTYPFTFKDKLFNYYKGEGVFYDRLGIDVMGTVEVEADAYGMMILPGGDTLDNVLRVKTLKTTLDDREPIFLKKNGKQAKVGGDSIARALKLNKKTLEKTEVIRWYAEGYRYPVFETLRSYYDKEGKRSNENFLAFFFHPVEQEEQYLPTDTLNNLIVENKKKEKEKKEKDKNKDKKLKSASNDVSGLEIAEIRYNIYPNPVEREIEVEVYLPEPVPVRLTLYSLQGRMVYQSPEATYPGMYRQTIPVESLPKGEYILHLKYGEKTISEKIIKR